MNTDHQEATTAKVVRDPGQDLRLQRIVEVGERQIAAQDELKPPLGDLAQQVSTAQLHAAAKRLLEPPQPLTGG